MKSNLRLNASEFSISDSTPPFANTLLADVFIQFLLILRLMYPLNLFQ